MDLALVIDRFRGPLVGLLAAWGHGARDASELAQDTFAEAYLARERFRGDWDDLAAVGAWLRGIATNLHRASRRRASGPGGARRLESFDQLPPEALVDGAPAEDGESDPDIELARALGGLRESWRKLLLMRYVEGSSLEQIGALLGLGERAVEGRLRRARQELKRRLEAGATSATEAPGAAARAPEEEDPETVDQEAQR